jgi:hypothetical protein
MRYGGHALRCSSKALALGLSCPAVAAASSPPPTLPNLSLRNVTRNGGQDAPMTNLRSISYLDTATMEHGLQCYDEWWLLTHEVLCRLSPDSVVLAGTVHDGSILCANYRCGMDRCCIHAGTHTTCSNEYGAADSCKRGEVGEACIAFTEDEDVEKSLPLHTVQWQLSPTGHWTSTSDAVQWLERCQAAPSMPTISASRACQQLRTCPEGDCRGSRRLST